MGEDLRSKGPDRLTNKDQTNNSLTNTAARIPIVAVTGTNGKTTTTRLVAYIAKQAGFKVGFTCSDGIYIQGELVEEGDCSGPVSAAAVLKNENIDLAVLECARGGILRAGLAFDQCEVAIITNVAEDHLDLKGINTLQQLADVKAMVALSVKPDGYAVLNADDDLVYAIREKLSCKLAYFSHDPHSPSSSPNNPPQQLHTQLHLHQAKAEQEKHIHSSPKTHIHLIKIVKTKNKANGNTRNKSISI